MFFHPLYFLVVGPGVLLALWATFKVKSAFARGREIPVRSGMTGAEAASRILAASGLHHVRIEPTHAHLGDHYDPKAKVLDILQQPRAKGAAQPRGIRWSLGGGGRRGRS